MRQNLKEEFPDIENEVLERAESAIPEQSFAPVGDVMERSLPAPPYEALTLPISRALLVAVVDDSGSLIPLCTAGDLLRGCKYFWRRSLG